MAFISHSNYGSSRRESAKRMREAYEIFRRMAPDVECDGEMHGDAALLEVIRRDNLMESSLHGRGQHPDLPEHRRGQHPLQRAEGGDQRSATTMGPILMGAATPAHVMTPSSTVRRVLAMTALIAAQAGQKAGVTRLKERSAS